MQFFSLVQYGNMKKVIPYLKVRLAVPHHLSLCLFYLIFFFFSSRSFFSGVAEDGDKEQPNKRLTGEGRGPLRKFASDAIT